MATHHIVEFSGAVEGVVDEAVLRQLVGHASGAVGYVYGRKGKRHILESLNGYNNAAHHSPWLVLVDLDHDAECAPSVKHRWLPYPAPFMSFRIVVREIEAWLLADQERIAGFLGIPLSRVPSNSEELHDPKETVVRLAAGSRRREIREDMVPRPGSGRQVGPAYNSRLVEFVTDSSRGWRPPIAAENSDSLRRCLARIFDAITNQAARPGARFPSTG